INGVWKLYLVAAADRDLGGFNCSCRTFLLQGSLVKWKAPRARMNYDLATGTATVGHHAVQPPNSESSEFEEISISSLIRLLIQQRQTRSAASLQSEAACPKFGFPHVRYLCSQLSDAP